MAKKMIKKNKMIKQLKEKQENPKTKLSDFDKKAYYKELERDLEISLEKEIESRLIEYIKLGGTDTLLGFTASRPKEHSKLFARDLTKKFAKRLFKNAHKENLPKFMLIHVATLQIIQDSIFGKLENYL